MPAAGMPGAAGEVTGGVAEDLPAAPLEDHDLDFARIGGPKGDPGLLPFVLSTYADRSV
jgi:hypothetical protein